MSKKIKVIFNCAFFSFHKDYCINIHNELLKRGHESIITESSDNCNLKPQEIEKKYDNCNGDITVVMDEECKIICGKGIYINHALLPVLPQHKFYYTNKFKQNMNKFDYLFMPSDEIAKIFSDELKINKEIKIVGFPKLDNIKRIINKITNDSIILYAPTGKWKKNINSEKIVDIYNIKKIYKNIVHSGHPADDNKLSSIDYLKTASIVISDYSTVGYDAILLNIPTILIDNKIWKNTNFNNEIRNCAIRVTTQKELINAINKYIENPLYLQNERKNIKEKLSKYDNSSKIFVDELENLI